jgi:hypothetical protein
MSQDKHVLTLHDNQKDGMLVAQIHKDCLIEKEKH